MSEQTPLELAAQVLAPPAVDNQQTRAAKVLEAVEAARVLAREYIELTDKFKNVMDSYGDRLDEAYRRVDEKQAEIERLRAAIQKHRDSAVSEFGNDPDETGDLYAWDYELWKVLEQQQEGGEGKS